MLNSCHQKEEELDWCHSAPSDPFPCVVILVKARILCTLLEGKPSSSTRNSTWHGKY